MTCAAWGGRIGLVSGMALLRRAGRNRTAMRRRRLRCGIDQLVALDVAAEAEAHGRKHLFAEGMLLPRAEAGIERRGKHLHRNRLLDRSLDGPAALARILDVARKFLQLRILRQR